LLRRKEWLVARRRKVLQLSWQMMDDPLIAMSLMVGLSLLLGVQRRVCGWAGYIGSVQEGMLFYMLAYVPSILLGLSQVDGVVQKATSSRVITL